MNALVEVRLSNLTTADVGSRAVVTQEGVAFDGTLTDLSVTRSDYEFKDRDRITASLALKVLEPRARMGDRTVAEIRLGELPLDYLIQIERVSS